MNYGQTHNGALNFNDGANADCEYQYDSGGDCEYQYDSNGALTRGYFYADKIIIIMSSIFFISEYEVLTDSNNFSVVIPAICNKKELLNEYSIKLKFPYFGANWDSLWDLICDFHWIPQKHIHIYHECITLMPIRDLKIFLKLLIDACKDWDEIVEETSENQKKTLYIYFNKNEEEFILSKLQSM